MSPTNAATFTTFVVTINAIDITFDISVGFARFYASKKTDETTAAIAKVLKRVGLQILAQTGRTPPNASKVTLDKLRSLEPTEAQQSDAEVLARTILNTLPLETRLGIVDTLLKGTRRNLNIGGRECDECGHVDQYENWGHYKAHQAVGKMQYHLNRIRTEHLSVDNKTTT